VSVPPDRSGQDFSGLTITYTVSGRIIDGQSQPVAGVTVICPAGSSATNGQGVYTLTGLVAGSYTLTPTRSSYQFTPANRNVSLGPSVNDADFVGQEHTYVYLPVLVAPTLTSLYVINSTAANVTYSVLATPQGDISCNISPSPQAAFCGRFVPGSYQVQVNAPACDNPFSSGTVNFPPGDVTREVRCR